MMLWDNNGWSGGWSGWMLAVMLAWPVLVGLAVWTVVALTRGRATPSTSYVGTARQVLDQRFAAGQVDADEYGRTRDLLEGPHTSTGPRSTP